MRVFVGFGGKEDGWYRLPDVYLCDAVTDAVAVRPAASEGKGLIVGLYGRLLREDGTPAASATLTVSQDGTPLAILTAEANGCYGSDFHLPDPSAELTVTALGETRHLTLTADAPLRCLDFTEGQPEAAAGALEIGPDLATLDLEERPDFAFRCYETAADGTRREVSPTWSFALSNIQDGDDMMDWYPPTLTLQDGRLVCSDPAFRSATSPLPPPLATAPPPRPSPSTRP